MMRQLPTLFALSFLLSGCLWNGDPVVYYDLVHGYADKPVRVSEIYPSASGKAIAIAIARRNYKKLSVLAADKALVNLEGPDRITPLWIAVRLKDLKATRILLEAGANPNVQTTGVEPVLILALSDERWASDTGIFDLLMDQKADPNVRFIPDEFQVPAIFFANYSPANIKRLVDAGADINARDGSGFTPLLANTDIANVPFALNYLDMGADWTIKGPKGDIFEQMEMFIAIDPERLTKFAPIYDWFRKKGVPVREPKVP